MTTARAFLLFGVRKYASESAESIQNAVIANLRSFQGDAPQEDDITLLVIKLL